MFSIVMGFIIAILIDMLIGFLIFGPIYDTVDEKHEKFVGCIGIVIMVTILIVGVLIPIQLDNSSMEQYIAGYKSTKSTYTEAINNESMTGLEKINLVKDLVNENEYLAKKQSTINRWWNFDISKTNKTALLELTPIELSS